MSPHQDPFLYHIPWHVHVAMLGSRQHYAVPRAFHSCGTLASFITDYWVGAQQSRWLQQLHWKAAARLAGRFHPALPRSLVHTLPQLARLRTMGMLGLNQANVYDSFCQEGKLFAEGANVIYRKIFDKRLATDVYFGFTSTSLETLQLFAQEGGVTVVDQIDPLVTEHKIVQRERDKWPGWENSHELPNKNYIERVQEEWRLATCVLVNSEWTAKALVEQGVPRSKIMIVPQAYEGTVAKSKMDDQYDGKRSLRVLWLGSVNLRKGIPYLIEAAKVLRKSVDIRVIGSIGIATNKVAAAPDNVKFLGHIPRVQCEQHWQWADVFVLPTLSDGFAMTQLEAMAHSLPVIVTPNCGEVVQHGVNGLTIEPGSSTSLTQALLTLTRNPEKLKSMSVCAMKAIEQFTLSHYSEKILGGLSNVMNKDNKPLPNSV